MAQSSNPALARGFGQGQQHASWNTAPAPSAGDLDDMYNRPAYAPPARFMTLDDVVLRTAATLGVVIVTGAVAWIANLQGLAIIGALVGFVLALVISFKQSTNPALAIGFSLLCIGIAAFVFLLDFDMIDKGIRQGAPERFAWYAAFGLTVTLVWLYLEILRLLSYFRD